jgi:hypothetical protein
MTGASQSPAADFMAKTIEFDRPVLDSRDLLAPAPLSSLGIV